MNTPGRSRGQMMVELIVGIAVITAATAGIFTLMLNSFRVTNDIADEYVATYLAAEGLELMKSISERDMRDLNRRSFNFTLRENNPDTCRYELDYNDWPQSWDAFCTNVGGPREGTLFLFDKNANRYGYDGGVPTKFRRLMDVKEVQGPVGDTYALLVRAEVFWPGRITDQSVVLEDVFYNLCTLRCASPP